MTNNIKFTMNGGTVSGPMGVFTDNSTTFIHENTFDISSLEEMQRIQRDITAAADELSKLVPELQRAISKNDKRKISNVLRQISEGVSAPFIANVASGTLLSLLGF